ncbi:hypothetical protein CFC21_001326 [Triticum aestivum]|uniref:Uncharacterized protein n=1 Tax=Triticum aestivum TaxID=4565 RepID=A0A3B5XWT3_WHEAT|nr:hypothetical protein CFC21_001326 [Triticum aestivum]
MCKAKGLVCFPCVCSTWTDVQCLVKMVVATHDSTCTGVNAPLGRLPAPLHSGGWERRQTPKLRHRMTRRCVIERPMVAVVNDVVPSRRASTEASTQGVLHAAARRTWMAVKRTRRRCDVDLSAPEEGRGCGRAQRGFSGRRFN